MTDPTAEFGRKLTVATGSFPSSRIVGLAMEAIAQWLSK